MRPCLLRIPAAIRLPRLVQCAPGQGHVIVSTQLANRSVAYECPSVSTVDIATHRLLGCDEQRNKCHDNDQETPESSARSRGGDSCQETEQREGDG